MLASLLTYLKILAVSASITLSGAVSIPTSNEVKVEITVENTQFSADQILNSILPSQQRLGTAAPSRVEAVETIWGR